MGFDADCTKSPEKLQVLRDTKFPWRDKKSKTFRLARLYDLAGYPRYGDRVAACASLLEYAVTENPDDIAGEPLRTLHKAQFCDLRLCPMCNARKAKRASILLNRVLEAALKLWHGSQYIFLTLTARNVSGPELGDAISDLCAAWARLMDNRPVKAAFIGWFRAVEVTRNPEDGTYHPHVHAILMTRFGYFTYKNGLYVTHDDWVARWRQALRVDYDPSVDVRATRAKEAKRKSRAQAAAEEAAKYATKDAEYIGRKVSDADAAGIVRDYTQGLRRKRLTAYGGVLKDVAKAMDAENLEEGDLVHLPDDDAAEDATAYEWYRWHLGVHDYVLDRVIAGDSGNQS